MGLVVVVCAHPGAGTPPVQLRKPGKHVPSLHQSLDSSAARLGRRSEKLLVSLTPRQPLMVMVLVVVGRLTHWLGSSVSNATWAQDL